MFVCEICKDTAEIIICRGDNSLPTRIPCQCTTSCIANPQNIKLTMIEQQAINQLGQELSEYMGVCLDFKLRSQLEVKVQEMIRQLKDSGMLKSFDSIEIEFNEEDGIVYFKPFKLNPLEYQYIGGDYDIPSGNV